MIPWWLPLLAAGTQQVDRAPLTPLGKWQIDYAENSCTLSRSFGEEGGKVSVGIIPLTGAGFVKIALIAQNGAMFRGYGTARLLLTPEPRPPIGWKPFRDTDYVYYSYASDAGGSTALVKWNRAGLAGLRDATTLAVKPAARQPVVFQLNGMGRALDALTACERDLEKSWGFDSTLVDRPPELVDRSIVSSSDYPRGALEDGRGGETDFRLRVSAEGKVETCAIVDGSGSADLDKRVCPIMFERGRFRPAIGKDGKPLAALYASAFVWMARK